MKVCLLHAMRCGGHWVNLSNTTNQPTSARYIRQELSPSGHSIYHDDLVIRKVERPDEGLSFGGAWLENALEWLRAPVKA